MMSLFHGPYQGDTLFDLDTIHPIQVHCGVCLSSHQNQLPDFLARMVNLYTICQNQIHYEKVSWRIFIFDDLWSQKKE